MLELNFTKDGAPYSTLYIDKVGQRIGLENPNGILWLVVTNEVLLPLVKLATQENLCKN